MQNTKNIDHLEMLCPRKRLKKYSFPADFSIVCFDNSQQQKNALFSMWEERVGDEQEVNEAFQRRFLSQPDCKPEKDIIFIKHKNNYMGALTAMYHKKEKLGHLHYVMLDAKFRGKRLSYPLLYVGMKKLHKDGALYVFLNTDDWRKSAIKLYLNYGFLPKIDTRDVERSAIHKKMWKAIYKNLGLKVLNMYDENKKVIQLAI